MPKRTLNQALPQRVSVIVLSPTRHGKNYSSGASRRSLTASRRSKYWVCRVRAERPVSMFCELITRPTNAFTTSEYRIRDSVPAVLDLGIPRVVSCTGITLLDVCEWLLIVTVYRVVIVGGLTRRASLGATRL